MRSQRCVTVFICALTRDWTNIAATITILAITIAITTTTKGIVITTKSIAITIALAITLVLVLACVAPHLLSLYQRHSKCLAWPSLVSSRGGCVTKPVALEHDALWIVQQGRCQNINRLATFPLRDPTMDTEIGSTTPAGHIACKTKKAVGLGVHLDSI